MDFVAIAIIINNYLHDLATGLLLAGAVILWVLMRHAAKGNAADVASMGRALPTLTKFAKWALVWIIVGGVPRVIFFSRYEWDPATVNGIVPALIIKHVLMFSAVVAGALMWRKASKLLKYAGKAHDLNALHEDDEWRSLLAALLALTLLGSVGCAGEETVESDVHPAIAAVAGALEVRMARSTDAADYEPYFAEGAVAQQLADSAASEEGQDAPPIPEWEPPYISEETSVGVDVIVVWAREDGFEDWAPATRMEVLRIEGEWLIGDAFELTEEELLQTLQ